MKFNALLAIIVMAAITLLLSCRTYETEAERSEHIEDVEETMDYIAGIMPEAGSASGEYASSVGAVYGLIGFFELIFADPQAIMIGIDYANYNLKYLEGNITDESYYSISANLGYKYIIPNIIRLSPQSALNPMIYLSMNVGVFNIRDSYTMNFSGFEETTSTSDIYLGLTPSVGFIFPLSRKMALALDLGYTAIGTKPDMFTYFKAGLGIRYSLR